MSYKFKDEQVWLFVLGVVILFLEGGCFFGNSPRLPVTTKLVDLSGMVIDSQSKKGVAGAQIVVRDYPSKATLSSWDGSFFLSQVPAGRQVLVVNSYGYATKNEMVNIPETSIFTVEIEISPFVGEIVGFIWDEEGKPISGATVVVDGEYTTTTQVDGSFALSEIPVGKFPIVVKKQGFVPYSGEVEVQASLVTVVNVILEVPAP